MIFASPQKFIAVLKGMNIRYVRKIFRFAFQQFPSLYTAIIVILLSAIVEPLAMSAFIPLSEINSGRAISQGNPVIKLLTILFLPTSAKYIFLAFILLFTLRIVLQMAGEGLLGRITGSAMPAHLMSHGLWNVLHTIPIPDIERKSVGHFIMLAGEEVNRATGIIASTVRCTGTVVLIGLYYLTILSFSATTAIGIILFLIISAFSSYGILRKVHRWGVLNSESTRIYNSIFVDAMNGVRSVRAFTAERYVIDRFNEHLYPQKRRLFLIDYFTLLGKLFPTLLLIMTFGLFILVGTQISKTAFDYAFAVTLLIFLMRFFLAMGEAVNVFLKIVSDAKTAQDISEVIEVAEQTVVAKKSTIHDSINRIEFQNVSFSHNKVDPVLKNFSFILEQGTSYAIMGESGVGKSTLLDLLLGFYTPDSGEIIVDGIPYSTIDERELRRHVILLGQETMVFNDTLLHNITYGVEATEREIAEAVELACLTDVIENLPDGFQTVLQYRGTNLSGGQRQRIGIARALLRQPDVLLFDESMSALDQSNKTSVIDNIIAAYKDKIVIFVSHDTAIREKVDCVIEMRKTQE